MVVRLFVGNLSFQATQEDVRGLFQHGELIDYFTPGEVAALYADWLIVAGEKRLIDCPEDGTIHRHGVEQIVARAHPRDA